MVQNGYMLYSYPAAVNLPPIWTDNIDGYVIGDIFRYEIFQAAFR